MPKTPKRCTPSLLTLPKLLGGETQGLIFLPPGVLLRIHPYTGQGEPPGGYNHWLFSK